MPPLIFEKKICAVLKLEHCYLTNFVILIILEPKICNFDVFVRLIFDCFHHFSSLYQYLPPTGLLECLLAGLLDLLYSAFLSPFESYICSLFPCFVKLKSTLTGLPSMVLPFISFTASTADRSSSKVINPKPLFLRSLWFHTKTVLSTRPYRWNFLSSSRSVVSQSSPKIPMQREV